MVDNGALNGVVIGVDDLTRIRCVNSMFLLLQTNLFSKFKVEGRSIGERFAHVVRPDGESGKTSARSQHDACAAQLLVIHVEEVEKDGGLAVEELDVLPHRHPCAVASVWRLRGAVVVCS